MCALIFIFILLWRQNSSNYNKTNYTAKRRVCNIVKNLHSSLHFIRVIVITLTTVRFPKLQYCSHLQLELHILAFCVEPHDTENIVLCYDENCFSKINDKFCQMFAFEDSDFGTDNQTEFLTDVQYYFNAWFRREQSLHMRPSPNSETSVTAISSKCLFWIG
jgi:hypothetical protein